MSLPGGIIFVNNDIVDQIRDTLIKQLFITSTLDGYEYDAYIESYPGWTDIVRNKSQRVMVIRSFYELQNRDTADVVIFVTNGIASIEKNNFGPPGFTQRVAELHWGKLCIYYLPIYRRGCFCPK
jgi:hypothetical protein